MTEIVKMAGVVLSRDKGILTVGVGKEAQVVTPGQLLDFCNFSIEHVMQWFAGDPGVKKCRGCQADILWIETAKGKKTPVNVKMQNYVNKDGDYKTGFIPHFATCPRAKDFKGGIDWDETKVMVCTRGS